MTNLRSRTSACRPIRSANQITRFGVVCACACDSSRPRSATDVSLGQRWGWDGMGGSCAPKEGNEHQGEPRYNIWSAGLDVLFEYIGTGIEPTVGLLAPTDRVQVKACQDFPASGLVRCSAQSYQQFRQKATLPDEVTFAVVWCPNSSSARPKQIDQTNAHPRPRLSSHLISPYLVSRGSPLS